MSLSEQNRATFEAALDEWCDGNAITSVFTWGELNRLLDAARAEGDAAAAEQDIPLILGRAIAGEHLSAIEQSVWSGYEVGWRDGWNEVRAVRQDGSAMGDGGAGVPVRLLSVQATNKSDRAEGVAALQQAGEHIVGVDEMVVQQPAGDDQELVELLRSLSALEPGWYANVGRHTGEVCCRAMRRAADRIAAFSSLPQQTALVEGRRGDSSADLSRASSSQAPRSDGEDDRAEIAAFLIEQQDEPDPFGRMGDRGHYWRDKCITAGQRLDPKRWGPK